LGFSRIRRNFGKALFPRQHIQQGGFANVTPSYKGIFRPLGWRTLFVVGITDKITGIFDFHPVQDNEWLVGFGV